MQNNPPRTVEEIQLAALLDDTRQRLNRAEQARRTLRQQNRKLRRRLKRLELRQETAGLHHDTRQRAGQQPGEGQP